MPTYQELLSRSRKLRREMTKEERHLWYDFLRSYAPRFTRQKLVTPYILDFYCSAADLAVELDGGQHYEEEGKAYDAQRTAYLQGQGIQVVRFSNPDVMKNFDGVCRQIDIEVKKRLVEKSRQP